MHEPTTRIHSNNCIYAHDHCVSLKTLVTNDDDRVTMFSQVWKEVIAPMFCETNTYLLNSQSIFSRQPNNTFYDASK